MNKGSVFNNGAVLNNIATTSKALMSPKHAGEFRQTLKTIVDTDVKQESVAPKPKLLFENQPALERTTKEASKEAIEAISKEAIEAISKETAEVFIEATAPTPSTTSTINDLALIGDQSANKMIAAAEKKLKAENDEDQRITLEAEESINAAINASAALNQSSAKDVQVINNVDMQGDSLNGINAGSSQDELSTEKNLKKLQKILNTAVVTAPTLASAPITSSASSLLATPIHNALIHEAPIHEAPIHEAQMFETQMHEAPNHEVLMLGASMLDAPDTLLAANRGIDSSTRSLETAASNARSFLVNTSVSVSVGQPQWSQAIGEKVLWLAAQNVTSAEIRLDPPELGPLQVRVSIHQEQASVSFTSHHSAVREVLDQNLNRLRDLFNEQGIALMNVDVSDKSFKRQPEQNSAATNAATAEMNAAESADDEHLIAQSILTHQRLVDHYV
jgi:flagellar hook-length control protein FliK